VGTNTLHQFATEQTFINYFRSRDLLFNTQLIAGAPPSRKGQAPWNKGLSKVFTHTDDAKERCRIFALENTNRNFSAFLKRAKEASISVSQINDGKVIATYPSISEAARAVGGQAAHISQVLLGKRKAHKGFSWIRSTDISDQSGTGN